MLLIGKLHKIHDSLRKQINTTKRVNTDIIGTYPVARTYNKKEKQD